MTSFPPPPLLTEIDRLLNVQTSLPGVENVLIHHLGQDMAISARYLVERCPNLFRAISDAERFLQRECTNQVFCRAMKVQAETTEYSPGEERVSLSSVSHPIVIPTPHYVLRRKFHTL